MKFGKISKAYFSLLLASVSKCWQIFASFFLQFLFVPRNVEQKERVRSEEREERERAEWVKRQQWRASMEVIVTVL